MSEDDTVRKLRQIPKQDLIKLFLIRFNGLDIIPYNEYTKFLNDNGWTWEEHNKLFPLVE